MSVRHIPFEQTLRRKEDTELLEPLASNESINIYDEAIVRVVDVTPEESWTPYTKNFQQNPLVELQDNGKDFVLKGKLDFWYYRYHQRTSSASLHTKKNKTGLEEKIFLKRPPNKDSYSIVYIHITVRTDFVTDFVSSPSFLWWLVSPLGKAAKPSVLHDLFYRKSIAVSIGENREYTLPINQEEADYIFYQSLLIRKVSPFKSWLMYKGLRLFGRFNFHTNVD